MGTLKNRLSEAVLACTHNLRFEQKYENTCVVKISQLKIVIFTAVKYCCILHGNVCVMKAVKIMGADKVHTDDN